MRFVIQDITKLLLPSFMKPDTQFQAIVAWTKELKSQSTWREQEQYCSRKIVDQMPLSV